MRTAREISRPKWGAGHAEAMFRQGLAELRALGSFSDSNVAQPPQLGLYGTRTPGEIAESRRADVRDPEEENGSILADCLRRAVARDDHGRDSRELEKE